MELKDYQTRVLENLEGYLEVLDKTQNLYESFKQFWEGKGLRISNGLDEGIEPYKNNVPGVPHVCAKVPTAGGKTFIAVNALDTIFKALEKRSPGRPQMVVWLVPSLTILDQTVRALGNPEHPYRRRLNQLFRNRVAVYEKSELLMGGNFSLDSTRDQLSIVVMSFDSLRAKKKEDKKIYQENGNLASFLMPESQSVDWLLPEHDATSLINVLRSLRPVVIVDESHNAESSLSVEMLQNLNPDFILDLTATPRNNSNIIAYVDALALKRQHMVKLPVIVANRTSKGEVIESALILRRQLETIAKLEEAKGGKYIRPIVLFQAQPKTSKDNTTFEKIRSQLLSLKIPAHEIKIKTADIDELKGINLMSSSCEVRYIITVNALKEGWDCPFAYVLASLADKSSQVDVEQILGRVLRMPHVQPHKQDLLNLSYVFTASSRFQETLQCIVKGLNRAGFSTKDYRTVESLQADAPEDEAPVQVVIEETTNDSNDATLGDEAPDSTQVSDEIDLSNVDQDWESLAVSVPPTTPPDSPTPPNALAYVEKVKEEAAEANKAFEAMANSTSDDTPLEIAEKMNRHFMKDQFKEEARALRLPQFFIEVENGGFFSGEEGQGNDLQLFEREELLKNFKLSQADSSISFDDVDSELYRIDLENVGKEDYKVTPYKLSSKDRAKFSNYMQGLTPEGKVRTLVGRLADLVGNMYPITDQELKGYIKRVIESMSESQVNDCIERDIAYVRKLKQKITELSTVHARKTFLDMMETDRITMEPSFGLGESITPTGNAASIPNSLYTTEEKMGAFEQRLINDIANLPSVKWWHRNFSRGKGFRINGFVNHYPDFIVKMKSGLVLALETKGDDRDNADSENKLKLGKLWEGRDRDNFRYFMVFEHNPIDGADKLVDALRKIGQL
jgi:type III restriction enzyme